MPRAVPRRAYGNGAFIKCEMPPCYGERSTRNCIRAKIGATHDAPRRELNTAPKPRRTRASRQRALNERRALLPRSAARRRRVRSGVRFSYFSSFHFVYHIFTDSPPISISDRLPYSALISIIVSIGVCAGGVRRQVGRQAWAVRAVKNAWRGVGVRQW